jgi:hypothetical protein
VSVYGATASKFAAKGSLAISSAARSGSASQMSFNPSIITASRAVKKVDLEEIAALESVWSAARRNGYSSIQKKNQMLGIKPIRQVCDFVYFY